MKTTFFSTDGEVWIDNCAAGRNSQNATACIWLYEQIDIAFHCIINCFIVLIANIFGKA